MADGNEQLSLEFPDPDDFESFDDVDSETVELPEDSFELNTADFDTEGCCVR